MNNLVLSLFLYFPEDKSEYIPAAMWIIVAFILAVLLMRFFVKLSKKEEEQTTKNFSMKDEQRNSTKQQ
ncbi:hypothetical protein M3182_22505 [Mesobacillus maritimus]|uniref:hypothetical protein n=1 Tax=Mesobacillus maritimus TaxID=1643336 RepID=UPI002040AB7E|nr:hypothetical protein [Mesobacillus maritimus]MCM3588451.1 hypothetical protein [Mesobacillus maritimus]MCM3670222.1 hypothetical protein [Mesobacillus maritimus]